MAHVNTRLPATTGRAAGRGVLRRRLTHLTVSLLAYLLFNGFEASTLSSLTIVAFRFAVTPTLLGWGLVYALGMGLLGGILPAVHAIRMPIAASLRQG